MIWSVHVVFFVPSRIIPPPLTKCSHFSSLTPAPHITTWNGLHYDFAMPRDILRDSYRRECATSQGCGLCTNVTFTSASFMPPKIPLESIPAWQKAHGVWVGNFTYSLESDSQFPGDYITESSFGAREATCTITGEQGLEKMATAGWCGCGCVCKFRMLLTTPRHIGGRAIISVDAPGEL